MKVTSIRVGLKRDVRLAKYNVSQCWTELTAEIKEGELEEAYKELHEDAVFIVEKFIEEEKRNYKEIVDANKNK